MRLLLFHLLTWVFLFSVTAAYAACEEEIILETNNINGVIDVDDSTLSFDIPADIFPNTSTSPLAPSERIDVEYSFSDPCSNYGAVVNMTFLSATDLVVYDDSYLVHDPETGTFSVSGDSWPCAHPQKIELNAQLGPDCNVFNKVVYSLTFYRVERTGWNRAGTSWETAAPISTGDTFCGNINDPFDLENSCANQNDHFFKITLAPGEVRKVNGSFTGHVFYGSFAELDLLDETHQKVDTLLRILAKGTETGSAEFTHTGPGPGTFFLKLRMDTVRQLPQEYTLFFRIKRSMSWMLPLLLE